MNAFHFLPHGHSWAEEGDRARTSLFTAFANFQELPVAAEGKQVVVRQINAGFLPSISYTTAVNLLTLPLAMVEAVCIVCSTDDVIEPLPSDRNGRGFDVEAPNAKQRDSSKKCLELKQHMMGPQEEATQVQCLESQAAHHCLLAQSTSEKRD
jgi:hypothetical protein